MPYRAVDYAGIEDPQLQDVFRRANLYLADCYSMLRLQPSPKSRAGACKFAIVLVLLCVIDGLGRDVYPTKAAVPEHEKRFRKIIKDKLHWAQPSIGKWLDKGQAAKWLYAEFRNPLTHELGKDVSEQRRKPKEFEPVIGTWGHLPKRGVDSLDAIKQWDNEWPIMRFMPHKDGKRLSLDAAALYWATKQMVISLVKEVRTHPIE